MQQKIKQKRLLIALCSYKDIHFLNESLPELCKLQSESDADFVVLDNANDKNVQNFIAEKFPQIIYVASQKNLGYGAAYNYIMSQFNDYDYTLVVTSDVLIDSNCVLYVLSQMQNEKDLTMCAGKLHSWDFKNKQKTIC